jgi:hypothetical protein
MSDAQEKKFGGFSLAETPQCGRVEKGSGKSRSRGPANR